MKKLYTTLTILVLSSFLFTVCEIGIGLGTRVVIDGPFVTISGPSPDRAANETDPNVNSLFNLNGTIYSENKTVLVTVTLDYWNPNNYELVRMGREWKWENGWSAREYAEGEWKAYTDSDYDKSDADPARPVNPPLWSVSGNNITWNLPVNMKRMESGDYFITVSAWDAAGLHDSNSAGKLKIKHSNREPNLKIIKPVLLSSTDGGLLSLPTPPDYSDFVFDPVNNPQPTYNDIGKFTNNIEEFTWEIVVPNGGMFTGSYDFSFEITNQHDLDDPEGKIVYYSWNWDSHASDLSGNGLLPQYGTFIKDGVIGNSEGRYRIIGTEIKFSEAVKTALPKNQITPMQIVTTVRDPAGNTEYRSKGWMLYLPDSDKPYSDVSFGYMEKPPAGVPITELDDFIMNRNSTNRNSAAYDDDGVSKVEWKLYKLLEGSLDIDKNAVIFTGKYPADKDFSGSNRRETWEFTADSKFGIGRFMLEITVTDIWGLEGDTQRAYFTIVSNYTPTIKEFDESYNQVLWGDENGNFKIKGVAQIEDSDDPNANPGNPNLGHGVKVDRVLVAWIKPNVSAENNLLRYQQHNDPLWEETLAKPNKTDDLGNKVWEVPSQNITLRPETDGNKGDNNQEEWDFFLNLNLFTDLNIGNKAGQIPFCDQVFRVKVISKPNINEFSSVDQLTTFGDTTPPKLEITDIYVKNDNGVETRYEYDEGSGFGLLSAIYKNYQVKLEGTWSEDSISIWKTKKHTDLLKDFSVKWESEKKTFTFPNSAYSANGK